MVVESHGFNDLLNRIDFLHIAAQHDAAVVGDARAARIAVTREATSLGVLEARDQKLAAVVAGQNNEAQALEAALYSRHAAILTALANTAGQAGAVRAGLAALQKREASIVGQAAPGLGSIRVNTGGMVQPAAVGAPAAVAQVMAAGNAIASLPYLYGGGHGTFHANAYDCSARQLRARGRRPGQRAADLGRASRPGATRAPAGGSPSGRTPDTLHVCRRLRFDTVALSQGHPVAAVGDRDRWVCRAPPAGSAKVHRRESL